MNFLANADALIFDMRENGGRDLLHQLGRGSIRDHGVHGALPSASDDKRGFTLIPFVPIMTIAITISVDRSKTRDWSYQRQGEQKSCCELFLDQIPVDERWKD
jgi:hypothetical protein